MINVFKVNVLKQGGMSQVVKTPTMRVNTKIYSTALKYMYLKSRMPEFKPSSIAYELLFNHSEHQLHHLSNSLVLRMKMINVKHLAQCLTSSKY